MIEGMYKIEISIKMLDMEMPMKETKKRVIPMEIVKRYCIVEPEFVASEISRRVAKEMTRLFKEEADDN